jgi:NAD(P)-dependent dehydrogenase (short-subunit alcohol dehydrogenase family)
MQTQHVAQKINGNSGVAAAAWIAGGLTAGWLLKQTLSRRRGSLAGQTVLITGGSRGLGLLLAQEFARLGCRLALCARYAEELHQAQELLQQEGGEVITIPCDVADRDQVEQMVKQVTRHYGQIDILVNNAGIIQVGPFATLKLRDFEQALDTMFWGMVYATMAVVPQMQARGEGRIVNITSFGGRVSVPHLLAYSSAKFAAVGFSEGLAAELAQDGIAVTTVAPGLMRTGSHLQALFKGKHEQEFSTFSVIGSLPILSMDARHAARQIVAATQRRDVECTLTGPAQLLSRVHGLWPGPTVRLLGLVNRFLPQADGTRSKRRRGMEVRAQMPEQHRRLLDTVTTLNRRAAQHYQHLEPADTV